MSFLKDSRDAKLKTLQHSKRYIYWHEEATKRQVSWDDWNAIVSLLESDGVKVPDTVGCKTVRALWAKDKSFRFDEGMKDPTLYVSEIKDMKQELTVYFTYLDGEKARRPKGAGSAGFNLIKKWFLEDYGIDMAKAFGEIENVNGKTLFDKCVNRVKYAIYLRGSVKGYKTGHMYKADISSAWPSEICDCLPNLREHKKVAGRVKPTAEYPIAYYVNSGHIAEYGRYDTHDWKNNKWYKDIEWQSKQNFKPHKGHDKWETFEDIADEDEVTILVPYSRYTLRGPIERLYQQKEDKTDIFQSMWAKAMMNSFIGYMRSNDWNSQHYMGHISALAYARATNRMLGIANTLEKEKNVPIYMAIDSIIWIGGESETVDKEKKLGAFVSEAEDAQGIIVAHGQYCLEKNGKIVLERHQGIPENIYLEKGIDNLDEYIKEMNTATQDSVVYDKNTHRFVVKRRMNI